MIRKIIFLISLGIFLPIISVKAIGPNKHPVDWLYLFYSSLIIISLVPYPVLFFILKPKKKAINVLKVFLFVFLFEIAVILIIILGFIVSGYSYFNTFLITAIFSPASIILFIIFSLAIKLYFKIRYIEAFSISFVSLILMVILIFFNYNIFNNVINDIFKYCPQSIICFR